MMSVELLQAKLKGVKQENYPVHSRIHPLKQKKDFFVKREDELGFLVSGYKIRKYRTLIPYLLNFEKIVLVGSAFSNHILGLTSLLIEKGVTPTLYLKGHPPEDIKGNYFFLRLLLDSSFIHFNSTDFPQDAFILEEGGAIFEAFLGALTLPLDILRNESEENLDLDHIWIDAGTGVTASALLLAFTFLQKNTHIHILEVAPNFLTSLKKWHLEFQKWLSLDCPFPSNFTLYKPTLAPSFGSTNRKLFDLISQTAKAEGILFDPIYSAKLLFEATSHPFPGNTLLIHSGGALTLTGFTF